MKAFWKSTSGGTKGGESYSMISVDDNEVSPNTHVKRVAASTSISA
jgi:hypothetical protein